VRDQALAAQAMLSMKSRRRMAFLKASNCADQAFNYSRDLRPAK
jgi:hypothetical protein